MDGITGQVKITFITADTGSFISSSDSAVSADTGGVQSIDLGRNTSAGIQALTFDWDSSIALYAYSAKPSGTAKIGYAITRPGSVGLTVSC